MLTTFQDIYQAVQTDINVLDETPLYPLATVKKAVNRAYVKCAGLFRWPGTDGAKYTTTQTNQEYYDYPEDFRSSSIWRIEIDGDQYGEDPDGSPMLFEDYLRWRADDANDGSTDKKWANQNKRFFVYPVPTTATSTITVWGQEIPDELSGDADETIFSNSLPEGNEAIVLEAVAILKSQGEDEEAGGFRSTEAKQILIIAWRKIKQDESKFQQTQSFFYVGDMYGKGSTKQNTGNFD